MPYIYIYIQNVQAYQNKDRISILTTPDKLQNSTPASISSELSHLSAQLQLRSHHHHHPVTSDTPSSSSSTVKAEGARSLNHPLNHPLGDHGQSREQEEKYNTAASTVFPSTPLPIGELDTSLDTSVTEKKSAQLQAVGKADLERSPTRGSAEREQRIVELSNWQRRMSERKARERKHSVKRFVT